LNQRLANVRCRGEVLLSLTLLGVVFVRLVETLVIVAAKAGRVYFVNLICLALRDKRNFALERLYGNLV
jgi:hypothetical protein